MESHLKFHSAYGKRQILIVDDEIINREMLRIVLEEEYELLLAATGREAMESIDRCGETLSLILLDLNLPDIHGLDILHRIKNDPKLVRIPVIVLTADREAEVESLTIGAMDFIPKPYPMPEVIRARVMRTIELSEDRDIIRVTERDSLTGLYNREYFYGYAEQFDTYHKELAMDAIVVNINQFRVLNERYGKEYADEILIRVGERLHEAVSEDGGIVCRREGDIFQIYCPHRTDYQEILDRTAAGFEDRVRLRMGVYSEVDKTLDMQRRFDHAKMAADTVRNSYNKMIAIYDNALHESEIFTAQLLDDFPKAIAEKQFVIYYQPKFDIRPEEPLLCSCEALVRWKHPKIGMISPGVFIPLFEGNGLIQKLDSYIWREAVAQVRAWKDRLGFCVPVSINASRVDMFDPDLVKNLKDLVQEFDLKPEEFLLEVTESAYTQDSEKIIRKVYELQEAGFRIEMDDFGSGYSSLSMIASMPIDALKLDMQFMRNALQDRKNIKMLEVVIDIANALAVPTVAEGVETAEQVFLLKSLGCDIVQGYYFSRPVPAGEFEKFLLERRDLADADRMSRREVRRSRAGKLTYEAMHDPDTGLYNYSAYEILLEDSDQDHIALMLANIDHLEEIRREYGKPTAEQIAERVAAVLRNCFRSVDFICRINKDDFVVILSRANSSMRRIVQDKVQLINRILQEPTDGLPGVSLSVGVAFADRENPQGGILEDATLALNLLRKTNRNGCEIY